MPVVSVTVHKHGLHPLEAVKTYCKYNELGMSADDIIEEGDICNHSARAGTPFPTFFRRRPGWGWPLSGRQSRTLFRIFSQAARIELAGLQPGGADGDVVSNVFSPAARVVVAGFQPTLGSEICRLVKC